MQEFPAVLAQPKAKLLPFAWPGALTLAQLNPIPQKYRPSRRTMRLQKVKPISGVQAAKEVSRLNTSLNVLDSIAALQRRRWSVYDLQHLITAGFILFSLSILPSAPLIKTGAMVVLGLLLLVPVSQQFFLPSLPIWTYLLYFFSSR